MFANHAHVVSSQFACGAFLFCQPLLELQRLTADTIATVETAQRYGRFCGCLHLHMVLAAR